MTTEHLAEALRLGLPYFGSALRARQGDVRRQVCFLPAIRAASEKRGTRLAILEIGSWAGSSTVTWAKGLALAGCTGTVTCVDSWTPYFDNGRDVEDVYVEMNDAAAGGDIFRLFLHNMKACGVDGCVEYHRGDSREVLKRLPDAAFDLIYIDGSHEYGVVRSDIEQSIRLLADGGIICGDDLELQRSAVDPEEHAQFLASGRDTVFALSAKSHYHPGVTEAVAERFGTVSAWNGFWLMRKSGNAWDAVSLDLRGGVLPEHLLVNPDEAGDKAPIRKQPELIEEGYKKFNLVCHDRVYGIPQAEGVFEYARVCNREYKVLFQGATPEEVRMQIDQLAPILIEEGYKGFNLVRYDQIYAIPQSEGGFDIGKAISARYSVIFQGITAEIVKTKIDRYLVAPHALSSQA